LLEALDHSECTLLCIRGNYADVWTWLCQQAQTALVCLLVLPPCEMNLFPCPQQQASCPLSPIIKNPSVPRTTTPTSFNISCTSFASWQWTWNDQSTPSS
jgi:hypothetical protein